MHRNVSVSAVALFIAILGCNHSHDSNVAFVKQAFGRSWRMLCANSSGCNVLAQLCPLDQGHRVLKKLPYQYRNSFV